MASNTIDNNYSTRFCLPHRLRLVLDGSPMINRARELTEDTAAN